MKLYFVGIGGIGTSALAQLCAKRGDTVTGSNLGETAIWPQLESAGIKCFANHQADHLDADTDVLIYSEAVPTDNPERAKAQDLGIRQASYFEYLGEVAQDYQVIAVTGTHGKTTTTAMLAAGLMAAQFDATMIVGSKLKEFKGSNFYQSPGSLDPGLKPWLVVEACEYRNNFQYLNPDIVVLTNLELDHVDYYQDEAHYLETFTNFCQKARTVIHPLGDALIEQALVDFTGDQVRIDVTGFTLPLDVPGAHNRSNASLALACAEELSALNIKKFRKGLKHYQGAWRRLELLSDLPLPIYDDYGHHPTEIKATLQALREKHPEAQVGLIFEPHQYSRTKEFFTEFLESFNHADKVALFPIYAARDTAADKAAVARQNFIDKNPAITRVDDLAAAQAFAATLTDPAVLIFMGAGNISDLAHDFVDSV